MPSRDRRSRADDDGLDRVFKALSDRTRRAILIRLRAGPASVSELAAPFAMSLPAVSKHLRVLESAGLLERTVQGRVHRCALALGAVADAEAWLDAHRAFWDGTLAGLAAHLEAEDE